MALENARLPSLKDKHRELTNQEIATKTEEIKEETKAEPKVAQKKSKSKHE